jgi:hypothetical protein
MVLVCVSCHFLTVIALLIFITLLDVNGSRVNILFMREVILHRYKSSVKNIIS